MSDIFMTLSDTSYKDKRRERNRLHGKGQARAKKCNRGGPKIRDSHSIAASSLWMPARALVATGSCSGVPLPALGVQR